MKKLFKWILSFFKNEDKGLKHLQKLLERLEEKYPLKPTLYNNKHDVIINELRKEMDFISGK